MDYEIDFLPVGNGERSGDAIAVRWGTPSNYKVLIYDGGTSESGEALVRHVKERYHTDRVDYVVSSHPDNDHASGLSVVLEKLDVGELWMHRPWEYSSIIQDYFHDGRITDESLADRLKTKMRAAYALEELATEKGIPMFEPFQGLGIGPFTVLSPEINWYVHELIPAFEKSPKEKAAKSMASDALGILAEAMRKAGVDRRDLGKGATPGRRRDLGGERKQRDSTCRFRWTRSVADWRRGYSGAEPRGGLGGTQWHRSAVGPEVRTGSAPRQSAQCVDVSARSNCWSTPIDE